MNTPVIVPPGYVKERLIVCAAVRSKVTGKIFLGVRHNDGFMSGLMRLSSQTQEGRWESGFIDQKGMFLTRQEAWAVAKAAGQIRNPSFGDDGTLYSEHLY